MVNKGLPPALNRYLSVPHVTFTPLNSEHIDIITLKIALARGGLVKSLFETFIEHWGNQL